MSAKCRQNYVAGPDTNGENAWLLEQLPHGPAGGLPGYSATHPFAYLAFINGIIVTHQITQGGHEFFDPSHALRALFLPQADRLQHEAFRIQPECSEVIRAILGEHLGGMNYFRSQHEGFCVDCVHRGP